MWENATNKGKEVGNMEDNSFKFQIYQHKNYEGKEEFGKMTYIQKLCKNKGYLARCKEGARKNAGNQNQ